VRYAQPLKVLILDPSASSVNSTYSLANHLSKLGCEVSVFTAPHWLRSVGSCSSHAYQTRIVFSRGTQIRSYEARSSAARLAWRVVRLAQHVWAMLGVCCVARKFDVIHTQIFFVPLLDYLAFRFMARHTPVVCTVHELVPHGSTFRRLTGMAFRAIYRLARVLFVYTDHTRDRLVSEYGIAADRIVRIPHGNAEYLLELKPDSSRCPAVQAPVILFLGGIRLDKGLDVLIRAAWHLRKQLPSFKVDIAGSPGFDITEVRSLVAELGLQDLVEFRLAFLKESEFAAHLSRATVVALPYRRIEQSGIAIAACTFGKAIVATRCGGLEELVNAAGNGLLVPVDDPVAFAEALAMLLLDEKKRKVCELNAANYARTALAWQPIALKTIASYEFAVAKLNRGRRHVVAEQA
jgi:glycosyltransferase involved in cell wall biosynthesis